MNEIMASKQKLWLKNRKFWLLDRNFVKNAQDLLGSSKIMFFEENLDNPVGQWSRPLKLLCTFIRPSRCCAHQF